MFLIALAVLAASPTTLPNVFAAAKSGDTIRLVAGTYPVTTLASRAFDPPLNVDATAATLTGIWLRGVTGVRWTGGLFDSSSLQVKPAADFGFVAYGGNNVTITGASFNALVAGVVYDTVAGGEISNNSFTAMRSDGIDLAVSRSILVSHNACHAFNVAAGAHPDCIQAWSRPGTVPDADIQIIGNVAVGTMQGFTLFDGMMNGQPMGGYDRITISNNSVINTEANGISMHNCRGCTAHNNMVSSLPAFTYVAQLYVTGGSVDQCGNTVVMVPRQSTPPCHN